MRRALRAAAQIAVVVAAAAPALAGPGLAVDPPGFDFGEARQHRTLSKEFRLVNFGDAELQLVRITTSCGCTVVEPGAKVVAPGDSTRLRVELQTREDSGEVVRTVLVETNDPDRPRVVIELRATVVE